MEIENIPYEAYPKELKENNFNNKKSIYELLKKGLADQRKTVKKHREYIFVNSWHIKNHESAAMWNQYLSNNEGVAIRSNFNNLGNCFQEKKDYKIEIGIVNYIDFKTDFIPMGNLLSPFIYKRKSFEYEDELRSLIWLPPFSEDKQEIYQEKNAEVYNGIYIPIDVNLLIEEIFVAPKAPSWIKDLVKSLTQKFGINKEVIQSDLATSPLY